MMRRRSLLCGCAAALGAGLFTALAAAPRALRNPCRGPLPERLAADPWLVQALDGLDPTRLVDTHAHLLGTGDAGSGCRIHAAMHQWWHPQEVLRRHVILDAACVDAGAVSVDRAYVAQLDALSAGFAAGARWWLFAFDEAHDDRGRPQPEWTTFHVPNAYAAAVAARHPRRYDWVASVHPYREDAPERLAAALDAGAVALKWLPSAMNIDLADARCRPLYERLARAGRPLIVHCGEERAVPGAGRDELGNPLHVRHALAHGVNVIVAHCASLGAAADLDLRSRRERPAFELFARLMESSLRTGTGTGSGTDQGLLLGDLSAVFQANRDPAVWRAVLQRDHWHGRLLHGSDHPLPGVGPLFSTRSLVRAGLLEQNAAPSLEALREHNPLLFDLALKRTLRLGGRGLPAGIFEGRALRA